MRNNNYFSSKHDGFTLVELLVYMGLLGLILVILTNVFATIINSQLESDATSSLDQDGRYILSRLTYDIHNAKSIDIPKNIGDASNKLQITKPDNTVNIYELSATSSGDLLLNSNYVLNSNNSSISAMQFQKYGTSSATISSTIKVNFTVTSRIRTASGLETSSFQTTIGKR